MGGASLAQDKEGKSQMECAQPNDEEAVWTNCTCDMELTQTEETPSHSSHCRSLQQCRDESCRGLRAHSKNLPPTTTNATTIATALTDKPTIANWPWNTLPS
eukprot:2670803-Amphidinium_carterae.1